MKKIKIFLIGVALCFLNTAINAEIKTPKIFSDNMMLQRNVTAKIWGSADPNAKVDVEFMGKKFSTTASNDGMWSVKLDPMKAVKESQILNIFENGKLSKSIANVLVGEVWILGGQSNMEWIVQNTTDIDDVKKRANYPTMRYFKQPSEAIAETQQWDSPENSAWQECTTKTAPFFSAMGFYAGERIMKELDVPVGLVNTSFGGSAMRAWVPNSVVAKVPFWQKKYDEFVANKAKYNYDSELKKWQDTLDKYEADAKKLQAEGKPVPPKSDYLKYNKPHKITPENSRSTPNYLFNAKIAPIAGFSAKAILWNQGETDSWGETLDCYKLQLVTLVDAWRNAWGDKKMHFICVQLPSFKPEKWPDVRWQQYLACEDLKKADIVNIVDTGDQNDVHPREKCTAGERIAKVALNKIYGKKDVKGLAPTPKSFEYSKQGVTVKMNLHNSKRLETKGELRGFEVLIDGKWQPALATLDGKKSLKVTAQNPDDNSKINGVRYLWKGWASPDVCLFNEANIPAITFQNQTP